MVFPKMSDARPAIAKHLPPQPLTAHVEGELPAAAAVDARPPEQPVRLKNAISPLFSAEDENMPLSRQLTQPQAMCASPPADITGGPPSAAIPSSTSAVLGDSCSDVYENRDGAATTCTDYRADSLQGTSKAMQRQHKAADAPQAHRCTGIAGSVTVCRCTADRCRAARALAAELISALIERPPEAPRRAQHPSPMRVVTPSTSPLSPAAAERCSSDSASEGPKGVTHHDASVNSPLSSQGGSTTLSHTFLEAVRNGRVKPARTLAPGTRRAHPQMTPASAASFSPLGSRTASPENGALPRQPSASSNEATASKVTEKAPALSSARKLLELVPEDAAAIPQLLSALREIARSCGSPDILGKAAGGLESFSGDAVPRHPHKKPLGSASPQGTVVPGHDAGIGAVTASSGSRPAAAPAAIKTAHASYDLSAAEEEHWHRVLAHFEVVRGLVVNEHELTRALDETLGAEWRGASRSAGPQADEEAAAAPRASPAMPAEGLRNPRATTLSSLPGATAAGSDARGKTTPSDGETTPTSSSSAVHVAGGAGALRPSAGATSAITIPAQPTASSQSGANVAGAAGVAPAAPARATLNHSARPFHRRTPPSVQQQQRVPCSSAEHRATASTNDAAPPSMKQLSETCATYSPSQQVTMLLDRGTTPPPLSRTQDEGEASLLNFPSTSLSETAAPYQPSASLMSSSPRGGNPSTLGSASFHLETREEMLRRRRAAPNAFYAPMSHKGAAHYPGGPLSAATTPGTFAPSSGAPCVPPFSLNGSAGGARSMPVSPLVSYSAPLGALPCPYEYLLVLDFEATCEEHPPPNYLYEIIEFPVVVVDVRLQRVVAEFHRFVRPRYKRELSPFCKKLTGISQEDVDTAAPLEEVVLQFERWLSHTLPPHARCVFATDGPTDLREFMCYHSVSRQGIRFPALFYQFIDVKQTFACFFGCSQGKIKAMLEVLHMPFEGRLHSGLDDARNIASIVIGLLHYGCNFCEAPLNRLPLNGLPLSGASGVGGSLPLSLPPSMSSAASCRTGSSGPSTRAISNLGTVKESRHTC
ncbi:hypothetical protein LSCM1_04342 [Leishmania martiniquensis]|uniref:Exonuclease domain-containing protein n=1 Tax=Leishmania martiniquensis TaxID=1580590 RepID=A0A836G2B8_9TRYP|nr:hypothetical protein LSCM1_04342 [Leishmania martiniquensis]